ncbi:MAG: tripartite tricarboxylate transporter substrate binding protein [Thermodesulfobacteriota bacterium]|nr:tripartite tricarboxylate transporter substrate binding protein [Thermodesulfobacteriota bacterium]
MRRFVYLGMTLFLISIWLTNAAETFALDKPKDYPKRPIEVVVPHGSGSGADIFARAFLKDVEKTLGVPLKFSFMPGAAGAIGTAYAMDQPADGYTLFLVSSDIVINFALGRVKFGIDDFIWLAKGIHEISALHTRTDNKKFQSVKDILDHCKANPEAKLTVACSGALGIDHVWIELLNKRGNMCLKFIPFDKGGERKASFQGGHTTFQSDELIDMEGLTQAGISRPILVGYTERVKKYPDVPCTKELGISNYIGRWRGFALKKGTPEPIVKYLDQVFEKSFKTPGFQKFVHEDVGHERPAYLGVKDFKSFVAEEFKDFAEIAKDLGWIK